LTVTDVVVIRWPEDRDEADRLAGGRVPRLLLVAETADPPETGDVLQDWVRLPGDERDVRARLGVLRERAADLVAAPRVDQHGRLLYKGAWAQLSPIEERLAHVLVDAYEAVVTEDRLVAGGWFTGQASSNALRVHLHRLRRRIAALGLEVRAVRTQGWVLQPRGTFLREA
jgi:DNA-binding response OmpR family regulator